MDRGRHETKANFRGDDIIRRHIQKRAAMRQRQISEGTISYGDISKKQIHIDCYQSLRLGVPI